MNSYAPRNVFDVYFDYKTPEVRDEFHTLIRTNHGAALMFLAMGAYAHGVLRKKVYVTDVWRDDPDSVHYYWRGVDCRCFNEERGDEIRRTLTEDDWDEIESFLATMVVYWPEESGRENVVVHGEGYSRHAHCQLGKKHGDRIEL